MTKLPEELHHILGEVAHPSPAFCGFGELGSYVVGLIYSLACTERAFDLIPLSHGLGHQGLPLRTGRFLRRPPKWLAVVFDFQVFEYGSVGLVHIDFVSKDGSWHKIRVRIGSSSYFAVDTQIVKELVWPVVHYKFIREVGFF